MSSVPSVPSSVARGSGAQHGVLRRLRLARAPRESRGGRNGGRCRVERRRAEVRREVATPAATAAAAQQRERRDGRQQAGHARCEREPTIRITWRRVDRRVADRGRLDVETPANGREHLGERGSGAARCGAGEGGGGRSVVVAVARGGRVGGGGCGGPTIRREAAAARLEKRRPRALTSHTDATATASASKVSSRSCRTRVAAACAQSAPAMSASAGATSVVHAFSAAKLGTFAAS